MILFFPVAIVATVIVLLDVGTPLLFWQQRIGQGGRKFLLFKFRTLKPPFDDQGRPVPEKTDCPGPANSCARPGSTSCRSS